MRSASVEGIVRWHAWHVVPTRRAAPARGSARGGARSCCSNASGIPARDLGPRRRLGRGFGVDLGLVRGDHRLQARPFVLQSLPLAFARRDLVVERLPLLHHLELAVLEIRAVALEHVDVGLHRLQLARRRHGAGVQLLVDLGGARPDGLGFVVEPLLLGAHGVALRPELVELPAQA